MVEPVFSKMGYFNLSMFYEYLLSILCQAGHCTGYENTCNRFWHPEPFKLIKIILLQKVLEEIN